MKSALALRHLAFEHLGAWEEGLHRHGYRVEYVDAVSEDLSPIDGKDADLMIVLGGPIGACDETDFPFLSEELRIIEERLASGRPLLGICLGAQLIARVCGANVGPMPQKEIGFERLRLTEAGAASPLEALEDVPVLHWHGDIFELPTGSVLLASTNICANQAFSIGPNVLGLQCHLEADAKEIGQWLVGHSAELRSAGIDIGGIRDDAMRYGPKLADRAQKVLARWLDELEIER